MLSDFEIVVAMLDRAKIKYEVEGGPSEKSLTLTAPDGLSGAYLLFKNDMLDDVEGFER